MIDDGRYGDSRSWLPLASREAHPMCPIATFALILGALSVAWSGTNAPPSRSRVCRTSTERALRNRCTLAAESLSTSRREP